MDILHVLSRCKTGVHSVTGLWLTLTMCSLLLVVDSFCLGCLIVGFLL